MRWRNWKWEDEDPGFSTDRRLLKGMDGKFLQLKQLILNNGHIFHKWNKNDPRC